MGRRFSSLAGVAFFWASGLVGPACVDSSPVGSAPGTPSLDASAADVFLPPDPCADAAAPSAPASGATPGPYAWKNVTILGGGFVSGIDFSPAPGCNGAIYARTDVGGAYRWDLVAQRWSPITDWVGRDESNLTGIESIAPDPVDPNLVYLAAGQYLTSGNGMILRSPDMGATWPQQSAIPAPMGGNVDGRNMGERLAVDPNLTSILYFASRTAGLWKSTDSAATWSAVNTFPVKGTANYGLTFVFFDKRAAAPGSATSTIYVGVTTSSTMTVGNVMSVVTSTAPSLYRTIDGGSTWQAVPGQPSNMFPHHAAMDYATGSLYFPFNDAWGPNNVSTGAIWKLDTSNGKWTNVSPPTGKGGFGGISVDATHPSTLVATTLDRWPDEIYRTTNGGASWSAIGSQATRDLGGAQWLLWHTNSPTTTGWMGDIAIDPHDSQRVLYETGQGLWWSDDVTAADRGGSPSWTFKDQGLEETVATGLISPNGGAHLLSAVGDIAGFRHDDLAVSPPDGMFSAPIFGTTTGIDFAELKPSLVVRVGTTGTNNRTSHGAYSSDGGRSWSAFAAEPAGVTSGSIAICADGSTFVWAPGSRTATPVYSRDQGSTWTASSGLPSGAKVASDRVNPNKFYATNRSLFYVSTDGGASFAQSPATGLSQGAGQPRPVFGIEGDVWVTTGNGLYHSTDSAMTFAPIPAIQSAGAVGFGMVAAGSTYPSIYMAGRANGVSGVYRSDDTGSSWQRIDDPEHQFGFISYITGDPRTPGRVYLGSGGRGILYGDPM